MTISNCKNKSCCILNNIKHVAVYEALRKADDLRTPFQVGVPWPDKFETVLKQRLDNAQREYDKLVAPPPK